MPRSSYKNRNFKLVEETVATKKIKSEDAMMKKKKKNTKKKISIKKKKKITMKAPSNNQIKNKNCFDSNFKSEQQAQFLEVLKQLGIDDPFLVLSKKITDSDTNKQQNRLLLPRATLKSSQLFGLITDEEKAQMKEEKGLKLRVLDQRKREYFMILKYIGSNKAPRIIGSDWRRFVDNNALEEGQILDLWAFRAEKEAKDGNIQLAMLNYKITEEEIKVEDHVEETDFPPDVIECARALMYLTKPI